MKDIIQKTMNQKLYTKNLLKQGVFYMENKKRDFVYHKIKKCGIQKPQYISLYKK